MIQKAINDTKLAVSVFALSQVGDLTTTVIGLTAQRAKEINPLAVKAMDLLGTVGGLTALTLAGSATCYGVAAAGNAYARHRAQQGQERERIGNVALYAGSALSLYFMVSNLQYCF